MTKKREYNFDRSSESKVKACFSTERSGGNFILKLLAHSLDSGDLNADIPVSSLPATNALIS